MENQVNVLYISSLGMSEPLGKSQVLEYLQDLSKRYNIALYSFEKDIDVEVIHEIKQRVHEFDITWSYQHYSNKYGVFTSITQIISSIITLKKIVEDKHVSIIHARSLIPVVIALVLKMLCHTKVIFDIRGFQVDEKSEVGRIKHNSFLYRILKKLEKTAYIKSDAVVTLTYASKKLIEKIIGQGKVTVIPTCANRDVFKIIDESERVIFKQSLGYDEYSKIIIHAGAVSNWYDFDSELLLIRELMCKNEDIHFLILNKGEHDFIINKLDEYNIDLSRTRMEEVSFYNMYKYLNIANASLFIIKPTFSKIASAPTKFAENLACGLFSITNNGIGDMDIFFAKHPDIGYSFDIQELGISLDAISQTVLARITTHHPNEVGDYETLYNKYLSKEMAIEKYSAIYDKLSIGNDSI